MTLHVGETSFRCIVNPPRIKELAITPKPMVNFNAFVDCKALDAKNGVVFKWYAGEMNESAEMEKDPLVLDTIRAGVDLTCTKKGVQKPTYFRLIGESRENRLKIEKDLEGKILVCLACPVVGEGDPSISGRCFNFDSWKSLLEKNKIKPVKSRCYLKTASFRRPRSLSLPNSPRRRDPATVL